jgi:hypothetical protein
MGLFMLASSLFTEIYAFSNIPVGAGIAGLGFGLFMAIYYAMGRRKYKLALWKDLAASAES